MPRYARVNVIQALDYLTFSNHLGLPLPLSHIIDPLPPP